MTVSKAGTCVRPFPGFGAVLLLFPMLLIGSCWQPDNPLDPRSPLYSGTPLLKVASVKVKAGKLLMERNETLQCVASVTFEDGSVSDLTAKCTWKSDNAEVATVGDAEGIKGKVIAVGSGTARITATYDGVSSDGENAFVLTVPGARLVSISVKPDVLVTEEGQTTSFTASGTYSDGLALDLTKIVTWTASGKNASGQATAAVQPSPSPAGTVKFERAGNAEVTASYSAVTSNTVKVTVKEPVLVDLSIKPVTLEVPRGLTARFTATGTYSNGFTKDLTASASWTASGTGIAVSQGSGVFACGNPGASTVGATMEGLTGYTANTATLTVTNRELLRIGITRADTITNEGGVSEFTATGYFSDSPLIGEDVTGSVLWISSDPAAAWFEPIPPAGPARLRIGAGAAGKTVTVSAEASGSGVKSENSVTFTATAPVVTGITITPSRTTVNYGEDLSFAVTTVMSSGAGTNVTAVAVWNLAGQSVVTAVAAGGAATINFPTLLATPAGIPNVTVGCTFGGFSSTVTLSFTSTPVLIRVGPSTDTVPYGSLSDLTRDFLAYASFRRPDNTLLEENVTAYSVWSSSSPAVADRDGVIKGQVNVFSAGSATISAAYGAWSSASWGRSATLTVTDPVPVSDLSVTVSAPTVAKGRTIEARAWARYSDNTIRNVTKLVAWNEGGSTDVILDRNTIGSGDYLTVQGKAVNTATITATLPASFAAPVLSASASVTVGPAEVTGITAVPDGSSLEFGTVMQVKAVANFTDGSTADVTGSAAWTFAPAGVLSIDASGNTSVALPAALPSAGSDAISVTASYNPSGTVFTSPVKTVTIKYVPISIEVAPAAVNVITGDLPDFTATAFFRGEGGSVVSRAVTSFAVWASSDATAAVAVAGTPGRFQAVGISGQTATISARYGGASSADLGKSGTLTIVP